MNLNKVRQVTPTVDDANDLDAFDRAFVRVGMCFKENEIRALDQHPCGWPNVGSAGPQPRVFGQPVDLGADGADNPGCRSGAIGGYRQPDLF
jgi:hypothetical protein